jgi:hypothetical protein
MPPLSFISFFFSQSQKSGESLALPLNGFEASAGMFYVLLFVRHNLLFIQLNCLFVILLCMMIVCIC